MLTGPDAPFVAVRPAAPEDLDTLVAIDARCFPPAIAYPREEMASLLRDPRALTLVAEGVGSILGFASVRTFTQRRLPAPTHGSELVTIDVLPEFRRRGLGRKLYQRVEDRVRSGGGKEIHLHVALGNTAALSLYESLGYRVLARVPQYYGAKLDAWRMEKLLL